MRSSHTFLERAELLPTCGGGEVVGDDGALWFSYVSYVFMCDGLCAILVCL